MKWLSQALTSSIDETSHENTSVFIVPRYSPHSLAVLMCIVCLLVLSLPSK